MKHIFEIRGWYDGGPNDRGYLKGYIRSNSKEEARETLGLKNGFTTVHEISFVEFNKRKTKAWEEYKMYKDI